MDLMRTNDAIAGIVMILISCAMIFATLSFPPFPGQKYGPSLFPQFLGSGLILCGLLLIARGVGRRRAGERLITFEPWTREPWRLVSFLMIPGLSLIYILTSETVGFLPLAFVLLSVLFLWFRTRPVIAIPVAGAATWLIWWFFGTLMRVPLPRGLLNNIL
jgi:putative tricarboxylic transport membrane protein